MRDRKLAEMMKDVWSDEAPYDFDLPTDKGMLMDFCVEQEWWKQLLRWVELSYPNFVEHDGELFRYLWRNLPDLVVEYRGEHE